MSQHYIRLVVFDMAGTTVHDGDAVHHCLMEALSAGGVDVTREEVNAVMGIAKPEAIKRLLESRGREASEGDVARLHESFQTLMRRHYDTSPEVREAGGAGEVFRALRAAGIRVALDTGFDRETAETVLRRLRWRVGETIDALVTVSDVARGRPYPDMAIECMRLTGISEARHTAKAGDTPADLGEGASAGCGMVIGVTSGSHTREELAAFGHTHLIETVAEIPALLGLSSALRS